MKIIQLKPVLIFSLIFSSVIGQFAGSATVSKANLIDDVTYLASDETQGRAASSEGIAKAGDYIAKRFAEIGLKSYKNNSGFKQTFTVYQVTPLSYQVSFDGTPVENKNIFAFTSFENLRWNNDAQVEKVHIAKEEDFRQTVFKLNQMHKDMLVTVDPSHQESFSRFKSFADRGGNKFNLNHGTSAVFVLSKAKPKTIAIAVSNRVQTQQMSNIVGVLPGKSLKNEYILYSAHYDHLGVKPGEQSDKIYNGADDDASGTSAVINLAEYYSQLENERSLIFIAFTAEELGGFGSKHFSSLLDPESIIAMLNIEMIGKPSKFGHGSVWMTGYERSDLAEIMNHALDSKKEKIHADPYPKQNLFYRSDNATLARLGVPAHSFSSSQIDIDEHYHQSSDEVDTLDLDAMYNVVKTLAKASQTLVDGSATPTRVEKSEVKQSGAFF